MSVESDLIAQLFHMYDGPECLPRDSKKLDLLVRYTVRKLGDEPEQAERILRDVGPDKCANYLIGALIDPERRYVIITLLLYFGPRDKIIRRLVMALGDPERRDPASQLLEKYGPRYGIVRRLVVALGDPNRQDIVFELLKKYGPSSVTIRPLVGALGNPERRDPASQLLIGYGEECLRYIKTPRRKTKLYKPIMRVIRSIRVQSN